MDTHTALRRAAKLEYTVLRTPLHLVDERVVQRYLNENSPVRQSFERALDALDDAVGKYLREPGAPSPDTHDQDVADQAVGTRDAVAQQAGGTADEATAAEDEAEQIEHLKEELLEEEETETFAGELAEDDELRQVQAELQAKRLIEEQQEGH